MDSKKTRNLIIILACAMTVIAGIFLIFAFVGSGNSNSGDVAYTEKTAAEALEKAANLVMQTENPAPKGTITFEDSYAAVEMPDIDKSYPITIDGRGHDIVVEIFCSPEKAGTGTDGWMYELVRKFNSDGKTLSGSSKTVGITLRSMTSGTQIDYIKSGVYIPDAISPSAAIWCKMLDDAGVENHVILEKTVGNTAGILIDNATYSNIEAQYGKVDISTVAQAAIDGGITVGYTNPFTSTTGLNFLASALYAFDDSNPLSKTAIDKFNAFQSNVPFVAYSTLQMRTAAENGTFNCIVNEYQTYLNDASLKNNYKFIPYGVRHDNPIYSIGVLGTEKVEALQLFADYCSTSTAVQQANSYNFNQLDDYTSNLPDISGDTWVQMQKIWKQNKNTAKPIAAVFVLDTSGSMSGEPINALKTSLLNSMKYINSGNYVGVVDYSSGVNVSLPIAKFDVNQQSYFNGAVTGLVANGGTATYSALAKAVMLLNDFMVDNPNVQPMVFLLSDGEANDGASFNSIKSVMKYYQIPIYTIGYNANLAELKAISDINEAASINADSDDVVYQLKNLFNANL